MIRRHLTPALLAFLFLLGSCIARPLLGGAWWVLLGCSLVLAAPSVVLLVTADRRTGILVLSAAAGVLLGAVSVARMADVSARAFLPVAAEEVTAFRGLVVQDSSLSRDGDAVVRLDLREAFSSRSGVRGPARGGVLLFIRGDYRFAIGERLLVAARLSPFFTSGPERYAADAARGDVHVEGFSAALWKSRAEARLWLHRAVAGIGYPVSALLEALLIGTREDVPASLSDAFLRTGSLHILALSGLHVTVLYGVIGALLGFVRGRWLKFALATLALLFYQVLAGFMPSLLRATAMILVGGTAFLLDRDAEPLNSLSLAGIVLVLIDPFQVFSLSFQLSFLAIAGILAIGPLVQRPLEGRLPRIILVPFAMSVGAQAGTLPIVIAAFGSWYPSGVLAGLLLVPLTTGLLWAGLAWLPLSLIPLPFLRAACVRVFDTLYRVIEGTADVFAQVPGIAFSGPALPWCVAGSAAVLVCLGIFLPRPGRGKPARA
jgi:competence protein ComEC